MNGKEHIINDMKLYINVENLYICDLKVKSNEIINTLNIK